MMGEASEPTKYSPSPMPMMSGLPLRAAIMESGLFLSMTTRAYAPMTFLRARGTASSRLMPWESIIYCMSWMTTSVSVWERKW